MMSNFLIHFENKPQCMPNYEMSDMAKMSKNGSASKKLENKSLDMLIIHENIPSVKIWYRLE